MLTDVVKKYFLLILLFSLLFCSLFMLEAAFAESPEEYVYFGFVPVSGDVPSTAWLSGVNLPGWARKLDIPKGHAYLDILAQEDSTHAQIIDLIAEKTLASIDVNQGELYTYYVKYGTYFKVTSSKPLTVSIGGGYLYAFDSGGWYQAAAGYSAPYLAFEGGFVGKDFRFMASPAKDTYKPYSGGWNCILFALEDATVNVVDSTGEYAARDLMMKQGDVRELLLRSRSESAALGASSIWHITSTGKITVSACVPTAFTYLPALTGGYVGRLFFGAPYTKADEQHHAFVLVVPAEEGKVTIYDTKWSKIAERTFTSEDIAAVDYWFVDLGTEHRNIIVESEGDVVVACGDTASPEGAPPSEYYIGDDISFLGARPNQLIHFFVPTSAVLFAPTDLTATIDEELREMTADSFIAVASGAHTLKATDTVIIQILGQGSLSSPSPETIGGVIYPPALMNWGSVLPSPQDIDVVKEVPEGFAPKPGFPIEIIAGVAVAAVIAIVVIYRVRKSRTKV